MPAPLTPEREVEIRKAAEHFGFEWGHSELLAEIDRLRAELAVCRAALGAVWGQNVRVTDAGGWYITGRDGILLGPFNSQQAALDATAPPPTPEAAT